MPTKRQHIVLTLCCIILAFVWCGCSGAPARTPPMQYDAQYAPAPAATSAPAPAPAAEKESGETPKAAEGRKIARSAEYRLVTMQFDQDLQFVRGLVQQAGGYFESSQVSSNQSVSYKGEQAVQARSAHMVARIPVDQTDAFIAQMRMMKGIGNESLSDVDMTDQYVDNQLRIGVLEQNLTRLQDLQAQSTEIETIIRLQREMNDILLQLDNLKGKLRNIDGQVEHARITLSIQETFEPVLQPVVNETLGQRMHGSFVRSTNGVFAFMRGLVVFLSGALPVLVLFAVPAGIVLLVVRLATRSARRAAKKTPPPPPTSPKDAPER